MLKITGEEWDRILFREFIDSVKGILDESVDIPKACTIIRSTLCNTPEYFEKINEKDVLYLVGISSENPEKIDAYKDDLKAICRKILASDIPNMGPPEDPYAWPSDEQLRIWNNKTDEK